MTSEVYIHATADQVVLKSSTIRKRLYCPESRKKQVSKNKYFFSKETNLRHDISYMPLSNKNQKTNDTFITRLWESLWNDGWRERRT